jgi:hypothetical protein
VRLHDGKGFLTAKFTPQDAGFRLYSVDLPEQGVDGVGRPTKIDREGALTATGRPSASTQVRQARLPESEQPVPVYPDGPVTLTVPVRATETGDAVARFTYAACSETAGCNLPVEKRPVGFVVTDDAITTS